MTNGATDSRRRVRRAFRWAAIVFGIVLMPFAAHALWDFVEIRRLVREVEAIRTKGEPLTQQDAARTYYGATGEHRRASQYYVAAAALALQSDKWPPEVALVHEWLAAATPATKSLTEVAQDLKTALDDERDVLSLVDTANALEFREFYPGTEYSYRTAGLWRLSRLVSARTLYFSLIEQPERAVESALGSIKLRRTLRNRGGFFREGAEIPAILSFSRPNRATLERLQSALETAEREHRPEEDIAAQRAWAIETWWRRYYGVDPRAPRTYSLPMRSVGEWVFRPLFTHQVVTALRRWAELLDAARKPWPDKIKATAEVAKRYPPTRTRFTIFPYARDLMNNFVGLRPEGVDIVPLVTDRCSRVAVAIERFRLDHSGALPPDLEALVPKYVSGVPIDPASGRALLYRQQTGAYLVYSVGIDGKDDGGDLNSELLQVIKRGWGRRNIAGRDTGIRVAVH
jgi:hypothetical protein